MSTPRQKVKSGVGKFLPQLLMFRKVVNKYSRKPDMIFSALDVKRENSAQKNDIVVEEFISLKSITSPRTNT
jgi:hypothetical protein